MLGIIGFGGIFTGTNPSYTSHELQQTLRTAKVRLLITESAMLDVVSTATGGLGMSPSQVMIFEPQSAVPNSTSKSWHTLLTHGEEDWIRFDDIETAKNTTAMLLFSSGTTGLPKAAMLSHYNLVAEHTIAWENGALARPYQIRHLASLPFFHAAMAPFVHTSTLRAGIQHFIMRRFTPQAYTANITRHGITDIMLVPPMVVALIAYPGANPATLKSLRIVLAGAAPLDASTQMRLAEKLPPHATFTQLWAMSETSCLASLFPHGERDLTASVGRFLPNLDVKLVDDDGNDITALDVRGELCIRGPTVVRGYFENPEANKRDWDEDGYFHTGDILYRDGKTGLWYIVDRKKELIKVRGFQVAPPEIEGVLLEHPGIADAAVIGVPDVANQSELPRAYVVRNKEGRAVTEDDVKEWVRRRLAKYKALDGGVVFVDVIPKTASGKILKRMLREKARIEMAGKAKL